MILRLSLSRSASAAGSIVVEITASGNSKVSKNRNRMPHVSEIDLGIDGIEKDADFGFSVRINRTLDTEQNRCDSTFVRFFTD